MHLFLPWVFLIIALIGAHLTEAVLQEIFWTLLRESVSSRREYTTSVEGKMLIIFF